MSEPWTCPFCALLCDRYTVAHTAPPALVGSDCPRANDSLRHFDLSAPPAASPLVDGAPAALADALQAAADRLRAARQPLLGGLATDVAGMRALYRLAAACGAVVDHAHAESMQHGLRALQDRGQYTCTLAEIPERAELIVCIGALPGEAFPEFWRRAVRDGSPLRKVVFVGTPADARLRHDIEAESIDIDLVDALPLLNALVAERPVRESPPAIVALADALRASRYSVLVWEAPRLARHGALAVEQLQRLAGELNRTTRAATFMLGGNDGAATAQQVVTWLSGLPLRSRVARSGLDHQPLRFGASRLLADGAIDALLWVASFGPQLAPPDVTMPRLVLGHPALAASCSAPDTIFIPVSTPGIGSDGHLFRTDSVVALPLPRLVDDGLPTVARIADDLVERLG
jgi:formylmethanofuran dehydrogenase subunit B